MEEPVHEFEIGAPYFQIYCEYYADKITEGFKNNICDYIFR